MPDPNLSTKNKATVVATTLGHIPYSRHFDTTGVDHRCLANDVTLTDPLFCSPEPGT